MRPICRMIDCVILLLLLPVLLPVGLLIAAVVFVDSPGSVFYRATRIGLNGHPFQMLKFRTMKTGSKGPGPLDLVRPALHARRPLPREVSPRRAPPVLERRQGRHAGGRSSARGSRLRPAGTRSEYDEILKVAPGITGLTQLVHFLDDLDTHNPLAHYETILPGKISLDVRYVRTQSFAGDVVILLRTLLIPFRLIADELKVIIDAQRSHPEAATRLRGGRHQLRAQHRPGGCVPGRRRAALLAWFPGYLGHR